MSCGNKPKTKTDFAQKIAFARKAVSLYVPRPSCVGRAPPEEKVSGRLRLNGTSHEVPGRRTSGTELGWRLRIPRRNRIKDISHVLTARPYLLSDAFRRVLFDYAKPLISKEIGRGMLTSACGDRCACVVL
jgi:hypothetical protein